jgi:putative lumazine-binding protein
MTKMAPATDADLITRAVRDYFEGWFDADVERMDRALHTDLVKRQAPAEPGASLRITTKQNMLDYTAAGEGKQDAKDRHLDIRIVEVAPDMASVIARSTTYHEFLQLVPTATGWKIVTSLWRFAE